MWPEEVNFVLDGIKHSRVWVMPPRYYSSNVFVFFSLSLFLSFPLPSIYRLCYTVEKFERAGGGDSSLRAFPVTLPCIDIPRHQFFSFRETNVFLSSQRISYPLKREREREREEYFYFKSIIYSSGSYIARVPIKRV